MKHNICISILSHSDVLEHENNLLKLRYYLHIFDDTIDVTVANAYYYHLLISEAQLAVFDFKYVISLLEKYDCISVYVNT